MGAETGVGIGEDVGVGMGVGCPEAGGGGKFCSSLMPQP